MALDQPRKGPVVSAITMRDADLEVTITKTTVVVEQIGPRDGRTKVATYAPMELDRLINLLTVARDRQQSFLK